MSQICESLHVKDAQTKYPILYFDVNSPNPDASMIPLKYLWAGVLAAFLIRPDLQVIPLSILKGVLQPGSLSNVRSLLL